MNPFRCASLVLCVVVALACPAAAQRPGAPGQGGPGRFGGGMGMQGGLIQVLSMPPVADELSLSDEQREKVRTIAEELRGEMMSRMEEARGRFGDLSPDERRERFEEMSRSIDESAKGRLKEVLSDDQFARLHQIRLQQQGIQAFAMPEVRERLELTDEQRTKLDKLIADFRDESRTIMMNARDAADRAAPMRQLMELRRSSLEDAIAMLTEDQQETWTKMTGDPVEFGPGGFGRGGFGPGGRPGAGPRP